jgi:hypothetical protein
MSAGRLSRGTHPHALRVAAATTTAAASAHAPARAWLPGGPPAPPGGCPSAAGWAPRPAACAHAAPQRCCQSLREHGCVCMCLRHAWFRLVCRAAARHARHTSAPLPRGGCRRAPPPPSSTPTHLRG